MTNTMIAALLREREAYVRRGQDDRVRQVDEQLAHHGYEPEQVDDSEGPQGRTSTDGQQQTADATPGKRGRPKLPRDDQGNIVRE
ncbi:hypothetical protein ACIGBH_27380 [Streptomyces sp. NPDC085929]|uniref:hypothetical protein n=1 Tax=Streptomyces sp. NPDC085929 TaxID=3365739 RepID=UPI0037D8F138